MTKVSKVSVIYLIQSVNTIGIIVNVCIIANLLGFRVMILPVYLHK